MRYRANTAVYAAYLELVLDEKTNHVTLFVFTRIRVRKQKRRE